MASVDSSRLECKPGMIDKRDIIEAAARLSLLPNVVEKDYVLGWILGGIDNHPSLKDSWVFKGGTCLKKCYFETYRFSEDLDFTLKDENQLNETFLTQALREVIAWVSQESGLTMSPDQVKVDIYTNPRGKLSCQGKIGYRGPVSSTSGGWPKIKLDLTADERLVMPSVRRPVFQPYSDTPEEGLWSNCYAYEEAFAEKLRALGERTRPRDLYDVVNLYRHVENRPKASVLRDVLEQKCAFKAIAIPTFEALIGHKDQLEALWRDMLAHQLPVLPPVANFWDALPEVFDWLMSRAEAPERIPYKLGSGEKAIRSRVLPLTIPKKSRPFLEVIRFAAGNQLCVDLTYEGKVRRIEPYSLRETSAGYFLLHAVKSETGENRAYRLDRIEGASVTQQGYSPRYLIELTQEGPQPVAKTAIKQSTSLSGKIKSASTTYVYRCARCDKTFKRSKLDAKLNPHKNSAGYPCTGRTGIYEGMR